MISTFFPQRFATRGNDGGSYFINQVNETSTLWWYGEHPGLSWAHVYRGRLITDDRGDRWEGIFIDVPKGLACGHGDLAWGVEAVVPGLPRFRRTTRDTGFGGTRIGPHLPGTRIPSAGVTRQVPGFIGSGLDNLTGLWIGDDGGSYYIREVSDTGQIAWVGENPEAVPPADSTPGRSWTNVLMGQRSGRIIEAEWSDVPKGEINQAGTMRLAVENANLLTILSKRGGFGGNEFRRVPELSLQLRFTTLTVVDQQEWFFEADEPYFLALIAMMDGTFVDLTNLEGSAADFTSSFVAPKLRDNVGAGTVINLSSLPTITVPFRPVSGDTGAHPVLGIALRGAEQDWSGDNWRANRLRNWIETGGSNLNRSLRNTGSVNFRTDIARWHETFMWRDEDDLFGLATRSFTFDELIGLVGSSMPLTFALRGGDVRYDVAATLSVTGARGNCRP